jgi:hypothetical protein
MQIRELQRKPALRVNRILLGILIGATFLTKP